MIPSPGWIDQRAPAEFAQAADESLLQQPPVFKIGDEGPVGPVVAWGDSAGHVIECAEASSPMYVPAEASLQAVESVDRHEASSSFDEPACSQEAVTDAASPVAFPLQGAGAC